MVNGAKRPTLFKFAIEEAVVGLFHHQSIAASLGDLFGPRLQETLAGYLIMLVVLIPYCAFRVLGETLGRHPLSAHVLCQPQGDGAQLREAWGTAGLFRGERF